jgi:hypothetical protein
MCNELSDVLLLHQDWQQLAEYTAILEKFTSLAMYLQTDKAETITFGRLDIASRVASINPKT